MTVAYTSQLFEHFVSSSAFCWKMIGGVVSLLANQTRGCHSVTVNRIAASSIKDTCFHTIYDNRAITGTRQALIINHV
jgi:hypothetical protein